MSFKETVFDKIFKKVGKISEPYLSLKQAESDINAMKIIDEHLEKTNYPTEYKTNTFSKKNYDPATGEIMERAKNRFVNEIITEQKNIEKTIELAYNNIKEEDEIFEPEEDWLTRYINSIKYVSDEEMQKIWAKLLSGELKKQGTYSYRTIETLKTLSKKEAELFIKITRYALISNDFFFIPETKKIYDKKIIYDDLLKLGEIGLLNLKQSAFEFIFDMIEFNNGKLSTIIFKEKDDLSYMSVYILTQVGIEILELNGYDPDNETIIWYTEELRKRNPKHKIITQPALQYTQENEQM